MTLGIFLYHQQVFRTTTLPQDRDEPHPCIFRAVKIAKKIDFDRSHQLEGLVAQRDRRDWNSRCKKWFTMKILSRSQLLLLAFFSITVSHVWSLGYSRTLRRAGSESQE